jgi:hypothetical protein
MISIKERCRTRMSDRRDGMEVGDDEEMSEVGSPPEFDDVIKEALEQNRVHLVEHEQREEARNNDIWKEVGWMRQFGYEDEFESDVSEWRETAAIKRYGLQYEAAGRYLDALAQVVAVVVPRLLTASTEPYVKELERMLPLLVVRYKTLVHPPAKFLVNVGINTFNLKEWRASNGSARMGSLMWHLECEHCTVKEIMQRAPETMWMKHPLDRLQRPEREVKQVMMAYDESMKVLRKSREHEQAVASLSMYRRSRIQMKETLQAVKDVQREVIRAHWAAESRSLERDITAFAVQMEVLLTQLPEPNSFYRDVGFVCELNVKAFNASDGKRAKVIHNAWVGMNLMNDRLEKWGSDHLHEIGAMQAQVWQAYKDKRTAMLDQYCLPGSDNWSWSWADRGGNLQMKKQFLRNKRPASNLSNVS